MYIHLHINYYTQWGESLCVAVATEQTGKYELPTAQEMTYISNGCWEYILEIEDKKKEIIEYKYLLKKGDCYTEEPWQRVRRLNIANIPDRIAIYDAWHAMPENKHFFSSAFHKAWFKSQTQKIIKTENQLTVKVYAPQLSSSEKLLICGNQSELGNWNPEHAPLMYCNEYPEWSVVINTDKIEFPIEFKFVIANEKKNEFQWETGDNRIIEINDQTDCKNIVINDLTLRKEQKQWKCAGTVIPLFSLRSTKSAGVGDFDDLKLFVDWAAATKQRIIQLLPINDTISSYCRTDSYPYSAISIYAIHPMYLSLRSLPLAEEDFLTVEEKKEQAELNSLQEMDYVRCVNFKLACSKRFFKENYEKITHHSDFLSFIENNSHWLLPYASFCYLRDTYQTADFNQWGKYAKYDTSIPKALFQKRSKSYKELLYHCFLQYALSVGFKDASTYAHQKGIALKGDLPIGISRSSVEAWTEPNLFNRDGQAGAPPDAFSAIGQNWSFPTYKWDVIKKDDFRWWKNRFRNLSLYFDAFRIDHILGFFRIWEIPSDYVQGLCGHFNPALPLTSEELQEKGLNIDLPFYSKPKIKSCYLQELFGEDASSVSDSYLVHQSANYFILKPFCDTQRKINELFNENNDEKSQKIKEGLFAIANEVLFLEDPKQKGCYHPRIDASKSYLYKELSPEQQKAFDTIYEDFFYVRHNDFWKQQALSILTPLLNSTEMLICGEDLGMIPASVPEVLNQLQIMSLEIERMPKTWNTEFTNLKQLPYHSVCTTSTHDMSPLRSWWKEDPTKAEHYYHNILQKEGSVPNECSSEMVHQIITNHLNTPSLLVILPLQDWLGMDEQLKRGDYENERINYPDNPKNYWQYRMHLTIEELLKADSFNVNIRQMIEKSGRS